MTMLSMVRPRGGMNCLRASRALMRDLDGTLDERTRRRLTAHLAQCDRCGPKAAEHRTVQRALQRCRRALDPAAIDRLAEAARGRECR